MTDQPIPASIDFMNHKITINPDWTFNVSGPEFDGKDISIIFGSIKTAREEVIQRCEAIAKIKMQNLDLNIRLLDPQGNRHTVTKINRRDGNLIGDNLKGSFRSHKALFPNLLEVSLLLDKRNRAAEELKHLEDQLEPLAIKNTRSYGSISVENYPRNVALLIEEVDKKTALAKELLVEKPNPTVTVDPAISPTDAGK